MPNTADNSLSIISTPNAPSAIGPYSQAIKVGGFIFTSGQIALMPNGEFNNGDIIKQSHQVLSNLKAILQSCDSGLDKVIKTTVFLANMEDFNALNGVYAEYFSTNKPARSTIAVKTLPKNALVEIECVALA